MYRIRFDYNAGLFIVQVLVFGFFWRTACRQISGADGSAPMQWETYAAAREWVESVGLDKLYDEQRGTYLQYVAAGGRT